MKNGILRKILIFFFIIFFFINKAHTSPIHGKYVSLKILDKVTSRLEEIHIEVGKTIEFGTLIIEIYVCIKRPPEEIPEDFVLLKIIDKIISKKIEIAYQGWMISSAPSITPFEHPIYDIWVKDCKIEIDSE